MNLTTEEQRHRDKAKYTFQNGKRKASKKILDIFNFQFSILIFASLCLCVSAVNLSCGSKPADLRALIPADSLVYLESNDLGAVMNAITERPAFREAAKTVPDFSVLNGVKLAVTVTGFETKELPVTDENSVLSFTPHFVAVLETNAWNFQAISFTQDKLGEFINQVYGGEVLLETSDKHDGKYFVWTAKDGRKAFALVQGSVVFFGNDETSIDKCLAVKRSEADSIAKNPKITDGDRLAFGYVSPDGIAQIANIATLGVAKQVSDEEEIQGFVARALPLVIRNAVDELTWSAQKSNKGIEDTFSFALDPQTAKALASSVAPNTDQKTLNDGQYIYEVVPNDFTSITRYNLGNPQEAWKTALSGLQTQMDPASAKLISLIAEGAFEVVGIEKPDYFLESVNSQILTVRIDSEGEKSAVIASAHNLPLMKKSITHDINFDIGIPDSIGDEVRESKGGDLYFINRPSKFVMVGEKVAVYICQSSYGKSRSEEVVSILRNSDAVAITIGNDGEITSKIAEIIAEPGTGQKVGTSRYVTETRFDQKGIERRTVSDFGFIGWIITQFGKEE